MILKFIFMMEICIWCFLARRLAQCQSNPHLESNPHLVALQISVIHAALGVTAYWLGDVWKVLAIFSLAYYVHDAKIYWNSDKSDRVLMLGHHGLAISAIVLGMGFEPREEACVIGFALTEFSNIPIYIYHYYQIWENRVPTWVRVGIIVSYLVFRVLALPLLAFENRVLQIHVWILILSSACFAGYQYHLIKQ